MKAEGCVILAGIVTENIGIGEKSRRKSISRLGWGDRTGPVG